MSNAHLSVNTPLFVDRKSKKYGLDGIFDIIVDEFDKFNDHLTQSVWGEG